MAERSNLQALAAAFDEAGIKYVLRDVPEGELDLSEYGQVWGEDFGRATREIMLAEAVELLFDSRGSYLGTRAQTYGGWSGFWPPSRGGPRPPDPRASAAPPDGVDAPSRPGGR